MKRIDLMKQMPIERFAGKIYAHFDSDVFCKDKPECENFDAEPEDCINCVVEWLSQEIKVPAESEAQTGAKDISIDSVAHGSEDVKVAFTQTCRRILDEVREAHKEYRTLDFKYDRPEVHMSESSFFDMFDAAEMRAEYSKLISKYEIMASVDDVLYFCLSDSDHGLPVEGES